MSGKVLFACSKCFSRHPFEELSSGQQLCKNCRGTPGSTAKCNHCRSEFQQTTKSSTCRKCEYSLKQFGKPNACECCNIVAAFGKSKCLRCASYESKYGPPVICEECKQRSAFDKQDDTKKINGKMLCWLCTSTYKRVLMKAQNEGRIAKKRPLDKSLKESPAAKKQRNNELSKTASSSSNNLDVPEKISRPGSSGNSASGGSGVSGAGNANGAAPVVTVDQSSSDHVVAMTQLKEEIAGLERRLTLKDKELLEKDKTITELKGKNFEKENDMRNKLRDIDRLHDMKVENLNKKVSGLLKEVAVLKKGSKKNGLLSSIANSKEKESSVKDSGGSGTDSPSTN